jgi:hypothetical protein
MWIDGGGFGKSAEKKGNTKLNPYPWLHKLLILSLKFVDLIFSRLS